MPIPHKWVGVLPIKRLPDGRPPLLDGPATVGGVAIGLPSQTLKAPVPFAAAQADGLNDEQRAIQAAGRHLAVLLRDKPFEDVLKSMIAFRQAYVVAYRELEERVTQYREATEIKGEAVGPGLVDFAVQYAMYEAGKPFSEHALMSGIIAHVLPWLTGVVDRHTEADENEAVMERKRLDEERRARPVTVGFSHSPCQECPGTITRERSVVLVGWRPAIRFILDHAEKAAADAGHQIVSLSSRQRITAKDQTHSTVRVALPVWQGCADDRKGMARVMGAEVADKMGAPPDLVICYELTEAYKGRWSFPRPYGATAGDGHKGLRSWCTGAGAALLAGVGLPNPDSYDPASPEWEQLKTFACLVPVTCKDDPDAKNERGYVLTIGNNADGMCVSEKTLARYEGPEIIVPGGLQ